MLSRIPPRIVIYVCLAIAISTLFLRNIVHIDFPAQAGISSVDAQKAGITIESRSFIKPDPDNLQISSNEK